MEYVKDFTGFTEVAGTDGIYLQNGEKVVRADNGKVIKRRIRKSGKNSGDETYRLRLNNGVRVDWSTKRVFGNKTSNAELVGRIVELNNQGLNDQEIAKILCVNPSTICKNRQRHGIKANSLSNNDRHNIAVKKHGHFDLEKMSRSKLFRIKATCAFHGVEFDPSVSTDRLIKRDGNRCYICGIECDKSDKTWGNFGPTYPTIDHVMPLSKGGSHTWDNVRLACGRCNCHVKSDKVAT